MNERSLTIIGVGNPLLGDDGVGISVINELKRLRLPKHIRLVDGGTDGFGLINYFNEGPLIIIDAVKMGKPPGTICVFSPEQAKYLVTEDNMTLHGFGLADVFELSKSLKMNPEITIIGIEPERLHLGEGVSPLLQDKVQEAVNIILDEVEW